MRGIEPPPRGRQFSVARSWACHDPGSDIVIQRERHRPRGFPGGNNGQRLIGEFVENTARNRGPNKMDGIDTANSCTKNVLQVGAYRREKIGQ
jgi:hypothetical protein